jgi:hypothetical protein
MQRGAFLKIFSFMGSRGRGVKVLGLLTIMGLILEATKAQKIQTDTNTEGAYTTGNKLDLPEKIDLYSPPRFDIPMLIDRGLYESIESYQVYKDNWIIDISDIDPKVFAPEDPNYTLAVQRRGVPYFYIGKALIIGTLLLLISRLFYGYLGGFRQKVKILKSHEKRVAIRIIIVGACIYFLFAIPFIWSTFASVQLSEEYLTNVILKRAEDSDNTLVNVYVLFNSNIRIISSRLTKVECLRTTLRMNSSNSTSLTYSNHFFLNLRSPLQLLGSIEMTLRNSKRDIL